MPFEFLMNALRLTKGVEAELFPQRTGLSLETLALARKQAEQRGLLEADPNRLVGKVSGHRQRGRAWFGAGLALRLLAA